MGVVVLGMHRSGTSAAARLIGLLGLEAGPETGLLAPSEWNPRGYWELRELADFDERLLAHLGGDWMTPPRLTPGWAAESGLDRWVSEGADLFDRLLPGDRWVFKDPRHCVLLPFWRRVLGEGHVAVLTLRHPSEVADSLTTRGGMGCYAGVALWEHHMRSAATAVAGMPLRVTRHRDLVVDPAGWQRGVGEFLGRHGLKVHVDDPAAATEFVDPELHRHRHDETEGHRCPQGAFELYELLDRLADEPEVVDEIELPLETGWGEALLAERRRELATRRELVVAQARVQELQDLAAERHDELEVMRATRTGPARERLRRLRRRSTSPPGAAR